MVNGTDARADVWVKKGASPYNFRQKMMMGTWWMVSALLFRTSFHKMSKWRVAILRAFGAKIGGNVWVDKRARIWFPWNLVVEDGAGIGFDALIYNLDVVRIGRNATVAQRVHINTGSHDITDERFSLITRPVTIGSGAFIGADTYINFGVSIGNMAVIGARSVVTRDMPAEMVCFGHPCRPVRPRVQATGG